MENERCGRSEDVWWSWLGWEVNHVKPLLTQQHLDSMCVLLFSFVTLTNHHSFLFDYHPSLSENGEPLTCSRAKLRKVIINDGGAPFPSFGEPSDEQFFFGLLWIYGLCFFPPNHLHMGMAQIQGAFGDHYGVFGTKRTQPFFLMF